MVLTQLRLHGTHAITTSWYSRNYDFMVLTQLRLHGTHAITSSWYSRNYDLKFGLVDRFRERTKYFKTNEIFKNVYNDWIL